LGFAMTTDVLMPKLSDTMEDGKILRWLKHPGDRVSPGDILAEVETDKADMELEAEAGGVLAEIVVPEGGTAAVGEVIARLSDAVVGTSPVAGESRSSTATPLAAEPEPDEPRAELRSPPSRAPRQPAPGTRPEPPPLRGPIVPPRPGTRVPPSAAPRLAERPKGREELSRIRRTVARRMTESKREIPHFYMTSEIDMGECAQLKESLAKLRPEDPPSYTHLLVRAVALALLEHPRVNARYVDGAIEYPEGIHVGIAVALEEGLIVPVLHDCERKDVFEIAREARALVERVRSGHAEGDDLSGGTFTISNLGMFPVEEFAAVINPPQAAVLAVGAVKERPAVRDGAIVPATTMRVTMSSDHRVIDGADAARFLATLKGILEEPLRLVL
jgi:pyruvate dehydrogenase E2 component (dihydrolipoamide acetyltransferase)